MSLILDDTLIRKFRDTVNSNSFFEIKYKNFNGKNKWNIICSCMDWIDVAVDGLPEIKLKYAKGLGYNHKEAFSLIQYIITIDILSDAIEQLFRVLFGGKKPYPLYKDKSIFNQREISDDKYFKHIRAVFSTHPVNLKSVNGVLNPDSEGEKFYASWPTQDHLNDNSFYVFLYSNNPNDDEMRPFSINTDKVNMYAKKRYELLQELTSKVKKINGAHILQYRNKPIAEVLDPIEQLMILHKENQERFGEGRGYSSRINFLLRILSIETNKINEFDLETVNKYRDRLMSFIPIILEDLQNMEINNLVGELYYFGYELQKVYIYLVDYHPYGEACFNKLIDLGVLPNYLKTSDDFNLKYLILDALVFSKYTELGKLATINDLIKK